MKLVAGLIKFGRRTGSIERRQNTVQLLNAMVSVRVRRGKAITAAFSRAGERHSSLVSEATLARCAVALKFSAAKTCNQLLTYATRQ
jgi:hypothetical protein